MTKITQITYVYVENRVSVDEMKIAEGALGWVNGTVQLSDGRKIVAGGGWLNTDGTVTPYAYSESGDVDELAAALGIEVEDAMGLLRLDCPRHHEIDAGESLD